MSKSDGLHRSNKTKKTVLTKTTFIQRHRTEPRFFRKSPNNRADSVDFSSIFNSSLRRPTSISDDSSCSLSSFAYESQMLLMLRKPCRPQGRLTVISKSVTSFTQPSISIPSFTFWKMQKKKKQKKQNPHKIKSGKVLDALQSHSSITIK